MTTNTITKIIALIASVLTALGLSDIAGVFDYINDNIEVVLTAVTTIVAVIASLIARIKGITVEDDDNDVKLKPKIPLKK